jgi:Cu+-exporting ATPase
MGSSTSSGSSGTVELSITGMGCGGCVSTVSEAISRVPGVTGVRVDLSHGRATVEGTANADDLVRAVQEAGYGAER